MLIDINVCCVFEYLFYFSFSKYLFLSDSMFLKVDVEAFENFFGVIYIRKKGGKVIGDN